ncbi:MAG TPA: hypothetical protein PLG38_01785 [Propionibacteriaceae bacterium]|nr:hypothetical protein [Propionibacteriaceae bacterium]
MTEAAAQRDPEAGHERRDDAENHCCTQRRPPADHGCTEQFEAPGLLLLAGVSADDGDRKDGHRDQVEHLQFR